jgi:hypothetical protein
MTLVWLLRSGGPPEGLLEQFDSSVFADPVQGCDTDQRVGRKLRRGRPGRLDEGVQIASRRRRHRRRAAEQKRARREQEKEAGNSHGFA